MCVYVCLHILSLSVPFAELICLVVLLDLVSDLGGGESRGGGRWGGGTDLEVTMSMTILSLRF